MPRVRFVLRIADPDRLLRVANLLARGPDLQTLAPGDGLPDDTVVVEVVECGAATSRDLPREPLPDEVRAVRRARIGLGPCPDVDVTLSRDPSEGEFLLACQLLATIAQLREQCQLGQRRAARWRTLAHRDPLTGLGNRRRWDAELAGCRTAGPVCLALLDLDHFKLVNARHGLARGDAVLQAVAEGLQAATREQDLVVRWGGDEFALWLPDVPAASACAVLERIRGSLHSVAAAPLPAVTASVGAVWLGQFRPAGADDALRQAETALRQAKSDGGNRTVCTRADR